VTMFYQRKKNTRKEFGKRQKNKVWKDVHRGLKKDLGTGRSGNPPGGDQQKKTTGGGQEKDVFAKGQKKKKKGHGST